MRVSLLLCALLIAGAVGCTSGLDENTIVVFAAASTADVVERLADRYEAAHGVKIVTNYASTSTLARQIESGARADIFLSANLEWMDFLAERELVDSLARINLLGNALVWIAPADRPTKIELRPDFDFAAVRPGQIAIGDPTHVPAGIYAKQALESLGWWSALEGRVVSTIDVRAALRIVERGEVDAGVVYRTDVVASNEVVIEGEFPPSTHDPIVYPFAPTATCSEAGRQFFDFLCSPEADPEFRRDGFDFRPNP